MKWELEIVIKHPDDVIWQNMNDAYVKENLASVEQRFFKYLKQKNRGTNFQFPWALKAIDIYWNIDEVKNYWWWVNVTRFKQLETKFKLVYNLF